MSSADVSIINERNMIENLISYTGESSGSTTVFDLALFKQLNEEFESRPVVPAPREHATSYTSHIGSRRCGMLERKIGIRNLRVLEVGCGDGMLSRALASEYGCDVTGVDIQAYDAWSLPAEGRLKQMVHDVTAGDNAVLGEFDRVVSFAVFEHIVHPYAALRAAYDLLKPGGRAYIYANLYRGAKASHRYREVFFPWPHLLFEPAVWREFYLERQGEPLQAAWVNKLTYDQYIGMAGRIGFEVKEHFPSAPYFDEAFYKRFEYQLAAYPKFDLMHDFIHLVLEKPEMDASPNPRADGREALLGHPPQRGAHSSAYSQKFWARAGSQVPEWRRYEDRWRRSRENGASAIGDAQPWVTFPAIDFLDRHLTKEHKVFEWGSGGSTLFFLERAGNVVSIEHDPRWFDAVEEVLAAGPNRANVDYRLVEPVAGASADWRYASGSPGCETSSFEPYVRAIEHFEDASFDLIVVDGRARTGCLATAVAKVKPGGLLLLDNANYPRYRDRLADIRTRLLKGWQEIDLAGPGPYSKTPCWETIAWRRPEPDAANPGEESSPALSADAMQKLRMKLAQKPLRPYDRISYAKWQALDATSIMTGQTFELMGFQFNLVEDDGQAGKNDSRSRKLFAHSWHQFEPLFVAFDEKRNKDILVFLCGKITDWLDRFVGSAMDMPSAPDNGGETFLDADTAVSNRFYRLAYLVAAISPLEEIEDQAFARLLNALTLHGKALANDANFSSRSNHGMLQALAQLCGAERLAGLGEIEGSATASFGFDEAMKQAEQRLLSLINEHVAADGIHKEHSFSYHLVVANALDWVAANGMLKEESFSQTVRRMHEAGRWMHDADGRIANIGDSDLEFDQLNTQKCAQGEHHPAQTQMLFPEGGYWFVKTESSHGTTYLAQSCAFHSRFHKQADSGTFIWHDRGSDILIDAGRYGYAGRTERGSPLFMDGFWYADPKRIYVEGTRAHNTIEIDGRNHRRYRQQPTGGTITSAIEKDGVLASCCTVPNAGATQHRRMVALVPGKWLAVFDTCRFGDWPHEMRQWFHLHPDWLSTVEEGRLLLGRGDEFLSVLAPVAGSTLSAPVSGETHAPRNEVDPGYLGWWSPQAGAFEPCTSFSVSGKGQFLTMATLFAFGDVATDFCRCDHNVTHRTIRLNWKADGAAHSLALTSQGMALNGFDLKYIQS